MAEPVFVVKAETRYILATAAEALIGLTRKAIENKIARGQWVEKREFRRAPDGRIYVDLRGFENRVEGAAG
jgi:hypothetical protein